MVKRLPTLFCSLTLALSISCFSLAQLPTQELLFPQLAVGGGWETEVTLFAAGEEDSFGVMIFFSPEGEELEVQVDGGEPVSAMLYDLPAGSAQSFLLTRDGEAASGYILVSEGDLEAFEFFSSGVLSGIVTYRMREGDTLLNQVGVRASKGTRLADLPFNNSGGNRSALALVTFDDATVTLEWVAEDGSSVESDELELLSFEQTALFVDEIFPESAGERGTLRIRSQEDLFLLALEMNGDLLSTSDAMPSVMERRIRIDVDDYESLGAVLRVFQEGFFLIGIVELEFDISLISGAIFSDFAGQFRLHLTAHIFPDEDDLASIFFTATPPSRNLDDVEGTFVGFAADGTVLETGTFEITPLE